MGNAAKSLGYTNEEILKEIGISMSEDQALITEIDNVCVSKSNTIIDHAKHITDISLIGAAVSLGYDTTEIAEALGISADKEELKDIAKHYDSCVADMAKEAVYEAALALGYSQEEAYAAVYEIIPSAQNDIRKISSVNLLCKESSMTILCRDLAKNAISKAAKEMGIKDYLSETVLIKDLEERCSSTKMVSSTYSLKSVTSDEYDQPGCCCCSQCIAKCSVFSRIFRRRNFCHCWSQRKYAKTKQQ